MADSGNLLLAVGITRMPNIQRTIPLIGYLLASAMVNSVTVVASTNFWAQLGK